MDLAKMLENAMARQWLESSLYLPFPLLISIIIISSLFSASWLFSLPLYQSLSQDRQQCVYLSLLWGILNCCSGLLLQTPQFCDRTPVPLIVHLSKSFPCLYSFFVSVSEHIYLWVLSLSIVFTTTFVRICRYIIITFLSAAFLGNSWNKFLNLY